MYPSSSRRCAHCCCSSPGSLPSSANDSPVCVVSRSSRYPAIPLELRESQTGGLAFARAALVMIIVGTVLVGITPDIACRHSGGDAAKPIPWCRPPAGRRPVRRVAPESASATEARRPGRLYGRQGGTPPTPSTVHSQLHRRHAVAESIALDALRPERSGVGSLHRAGPGNEQSGGVGRRCVRGRANERRGPEAPAGVRR